MMSIRIICIRTLITVMPAMRNRNSRKISSSTSTLSFAPPIKMCTYGILMLWMMTMFRMLMILMVFMMLTLRRILMEDLWWPKPSSASLYLIFKGSSIYHWIPPVNAMFPNRTTAKPWETMS